jgi:hypothetical protein
MLAASQVKGLQDRAAIAPEPIYVDYLYMISSRLFGTDPTVKSRVIVPGEPYQINVALADLPNSDPLYIWWELLEQHPSKKSAELYSILTILHPTQDGHHAVKRFYRPPGDTSKNTRGSDLITLLFDLPSVRQERLHLRPKELQYSPDRQCFMDVNSEDIEMLIRLAEKALATPR